LTWNCSLLHDAKPIMASIAKVDFLIIDAIVLIAFYLYSICKSSGIKANIQNYAVEFLYFR